MNFRALMNDGDLVRTLEDVLAKIKTLDTQTMFETLKDGILEIVGPKNVGFKDNEIAIYKMSKKKFQLVNNLLKTYGEGSDIPQSLLIKTVNLKDSFRIIKKK